MAASNDDNDDEVKLMVTTSWAEYQPPYDWHSFVEQVEPVSIASPGSNGTGLYNNQTSPHGSAIESALLSSAAAAAAGGDGDGIIENRSLPEIVAVCFVVVVLSLITSGGNLLVIVSFKMDVQLQTVSNYFLLSLSVADLTIGLVSMPLYSVYLLMNYWPLGPIVCDAWLSLDYTMSNASVANLLLISFDRYFSVTRPLTYRARRTSTRAAAPRASGGPITTIAGATCRRPHVSAHAWPAKNSSSKRSTSAWAT